MEDQFEDQQDDAFVGTVKKALTTYEEEDVDTPRARP